MIKLCAVVGVCFGGAFLYATFFASRDRTDTITFGLTTVLLAGLGAGGWWFQTTFHKYTVILSPTGVKVGAGRWIAWGEIRSLRERPRNQRVDLLGASGEIEASIEYQIEGFEQVMIAVRARLYKPPMNWQRKFGQRRPMRYIVANLVFFVSFFALCVWLWFDERHWLGLVGPPILLLLLYHELTSSVREVEIVREGLVLRTFLRVKRVPRQDITSAAMSLDSLGKGRQALVTVLHLVDGSRLPVNPPGVDQHELLETIQAWMQSSLAIGKQTSP